MLYELLWYLDYGSDLLELTELIKLNRPFSSCKVIHDKVNKAFFRVLYKDWQSGRWDGVESELARIVLSASEPYTLLITPRHWVENNGVLIDQVDGFQKLGGGCSKIKELLEVGVSLNHFSYPDSLSRPKSPASSETLPASVPCYSCPAS